MRQVLIGTSGWVYDDWVGPFYPKALSRDRWLSYYAEHFPVVEVNATHYHFPDRAWVAGMVDRMDQSLLTHAVFKAPRQITHEATHDGDTDAVQARSRELFKALEPAVGAELLAGILYQFDHATGPAELLPAVAAARHARPPAPLFVEVRHAAFNEERHYDALMDLVEPTGGTVVATDSPASTITRAPPAERAYFRFHGRNEETWFLENPPGVHGSARYDYDYPPSELSALAQRIQEAESSQVLVFFNNHVDGQSTRNATAMMDLLGLEPPKKRATLDDFT